jgi:tape measure domain-containing protein
MALQVGELFASLRLDDAQFNSGLGRAEGQFEGLGGKLVGIASKYATMIGASIGAAMSVKTGVEYNAMQEQSTVAWTTLLGSATKAKDMLQRIADFAKSTPFETADVDMMAKYMHNAGYEGKALFDQLMKISDVSSAFAVPAADAKEMARQMSQVQQAGVAYTEDLNILQDRGIPIYKAIAEQMNTNVGAVRKMASQGQISADIYMKAFNKVASGVKGASDAQSQTFSGMISTMKDSFDMLAGYLSKPIFNVLKSGLSGLTTVLGAFVDLSRGNLKSFNETMDKVFGSGASQKIMAFVNGFKGIFGAIKGEIDKGKQALVGIFSIFKGGGGEGKGISILDNLGFSTKTIANIQAIVAQVKNGMGQVGQAVGKASGIVQGLFHLFTGNTGKGVSILNMVGLNTTQISQIMAGVQKVKSTITGFFSGYISAVKNLFTGNGNIGQSFARIFNVIKSLAVPILQDAIKFIMSIIDNVKSFWAKNGTQIMQAIKNFWNVIATIFEAIKPVLMFILTSIWDAIKGVISGALKVIQGIILVFTGIFTLNFGTLWEGIKDIFFGALQFIWNWVQLIFIGKIFGGIKAGFTAVVENAKGWIEAVKGIFSNLEGNISRITKAIVNWVVNGFKKLGSDVAYVWNWLRQTGSSVWSTIWNTIKSMVTNIARDLVNGFHNAVNTVINVFRNLPSNIRGLATHVWGVVKDMATNIWNAVKGLPRQMLQIGGDIMSGLANGISNGVKNVISKAKDIAGSIGKTIKGALGIASPSKVTTEIGLFTAQGLEVGMDKRVRHVQTMAKKLAKAAVPDVGAVKMSMPTLLGGDYSSKQQTIITVPVMIDGKEVARATTQHTSKNQYRASRTNLRSRGL